MDTTQVIDELAKKFGATGEYLVKELARYSITKDIVSIVISILLICASVIAVKIMFKKMNDGDWDEDDIQVLAISTSAIIASVCGIVVFIIHLTDCIGWIVSPTAAAINYIMR